MAKNDHLGPREWKLRADAPDGSSAARLAQLSAETGLTAITLRVCLMRGLETAKAIQEFLNPRFESVTSPLKIKDMDKAVERLARARTDSEKVRVFGDYDVDGTTGAALLSWIFRDFGFTHDVRQPDRFKDGYGLNVKAVEEAHEAGIRLLVTVDCGISSFDAAEKARALGVDLIVVDHHQLDPKKGLPPAVAVLNPQRPDCESQLKMLCGCGLAFYLAMALRMHGRTSGWWEDSKEPNLKQHLDLVVMATAADMVPLLGDNHILVRFGLEVLKKSSKPGVRALLEAAGLAQRDISPGHLGFVLGPRINASGRMHSASLALELLTTTDAPRALQLARELEKLNEERASVQNAIWDEVRVRVEQGIAEGKFEHGIVVADPGWHEGVVGIVASRVTETFRRPAAVIAIRHDPAGQSGAQPGQESYDFAKGSVRSFAGKDVLAALRASAEHLLGFGGHRHAAGLSLKPENIDAFAAAFDAALGGMEEDVGARPLMIEGECAIDELDVRTLQEIERLGPFGPGNPEPVFSVRGTVRHHTVLKGRHLKLTLSPVGASRRAVMEAIWFNAAERPELLDDVTTAELEGEFAGVPELNRFRGNVTPTLRVRDWRRARPPL